MNHNITCYGYTIEIDRAGKFDVNKAKENNVEMQYWNRLQKGETIESPDRTLTSDLVLGPSRKGIKCTYTTDTRPTDSIVEHAKDADLFICEGMYGELEKKAKAVEYKHMTFYEAKRNGKESLCEGNVAYALQPVFSKTGAIYGRSKKDICHCQCGKDGKSTTLLFEEE